MASIVTTTCLALAGADLAADPVAEALQRGLLAEEVNHNLADAVSAYEEAVRLSAEQRSAQAAALYHLADCQRRLGHPAEARENFRRVAREYPDQKRFAELAARAEPDDTGERAAQIRPQGSPQAWTEAESSRNLLAELKRQAESAAEEARSKRSAVDKIQASPSDLRPRLIQATAANPLIEALLRDLLEAEIQARELATRFGGEHPDVKANRAKVEVLEKRLAAEEEAVLAILRGQADEQHDKAERLAAKCRELAVKLDKEAQEARAAGSPGQPEGAEPTDLLEAKVLAQIQRLAVESPDRLKDFLPRAVRDGHVKVVQFLIAGGVDPDPGGPINETPLAAAAGSGNFAIVRILLEAGADPNKTLARGVNALHEAARNGHLKVVEHLLDHGADPSKPAGDAAFFRRGGALHFAAMGNHVHVVQALLARGALLDAADAGGRTPLFCAVAERAREAAKVLIEAGANPNLGGDKVNIDRGTKSDLRSPELLGTLLEPWKTPLGMAAGQGDADLVKILLTGGALPDFSDASGATPLHKAVAARADAACRLLLDAGANPNARDLWGRTPMMCETTARVTAMLAEAGGTNHVAPAEEVSGSRSQRTVHIFGAVDARLPLEGPGPWRTADLISKARPGPRADAKNARVVELIADDATQSLIASPAEDVGAGFLNVGAGPLLLVEAPGTPR